eukprot:TRINITY_DN1986_c0_g1_i1.p1 TRINITY_DN1986_c0_g1~~TRINITY_DN1986_c0_g1_i1.p1  ORF type:complete len:170 (+),score=20.60 TRINITY_DN1986_c0_g1_i1:182-691(+)
MVYYLFWLCSILCLFVEAFHDGILEPDQVVNEKIVSGQTKFYLLQGLKPDSYYEQPMAFYLQLVGENVRSGRHLLNTEKVTFQTDYNGRIKNVPPSQSFYVEVRAQFEGVTLQPITELPDVSYDIVLETLFHGLPFPIFKIGGLLVVFFLLSFLIPQFSSLLRLKPHRD